jgi:hypothetical protein
VVYYQNHRKNDGALVSNAENKEVESGRNRKHLLLNFLQVVGFPIKISQTKATIRIEGRHDEDARRNMAGFSANFNLLASDHFNL